MGPRLCDILEHAIGYPARQRRRQKPQLAGLWRAGPGSYWFETEATAYWRPGGALAARLSVRYEILISSRLILEPELEASLYSRSDPERETGSGLSDIGTGLRLRYEVTRQFAPYIGVTWSRQFGRSADFARLGGGKRSEAQAVAGVRFWF